MLPLILADPPAVTQIHRADRQATSKTLADMLAVLCFISLEQGSSDLRSALRTFDQHGPLALEAFRRHGPEGFALVSLYGPILEAVGRRPAARSELDPPPGQRRLHRRAAANAPARDRRRPPAARGGGRLDRSGRAAARMRCGWSSNSADPGERALKKAGPDAADVVFGDFGDPDLAPSGGATRSRRTAPMALAILDKYAADPDFREILRTHGAAVIPPIAQADAGPETLAYLGAKTHRSFTESLALAASICLGRQRSGHDPDDQE